MELDREPPQHEDFRNFLDWQSKRPESLDNFGYLLLSPDEAHQKEAVEKIRAEFQFWRMG